MSIAVTAVSIVYPKYRFCVRSIHDHYGSFVLLNYFTSLFSQGILHSKTF